jgi:glyoxalase family protein
VKLDGIHHITAITGDARRNLDFYTGVLGLRLVAKSVNQDEGQPTYHLFYANEQATPGAELTFFEYPGIPRGRAGAGMVHRITWRLASSEAIDFWSGRLSDAGVDFTAKGDRVRFNDPEGLGLELAVVVTDDDPLIAYHPEIPSRLALHGFHAVEAATSDVDRSRRLLEETLGFAPRGEQLWEARGSRRGGFYGYRDGTPGYGRQGAGTVHHVAWRAASDDEHPRWRERLIEGGASPTPVIDRYYFNSIYFREPSGVLFEIASPGPGFTRDTGLENLGLEVALPPWLEPRRAEIESQLTPLPNPREGWANAHEPASADASGR